MAGSRQPIVNRGPNSAARQRRLTLALMACNQQQDPVPASNRPLQSQVNGLPRAVEAVAMKIKRPVRLDPSRSKPPVPAAVKRRGLEALARCRRR
jgi:hypothetical protein